MNTSSVLTSRGAYATARGDVVSVGTTSTDLETLLDESPILENLKEITLLNQHASTAVYFAIGGTASADTLLLNAGASITLPVTAEVAATIQLYAASTVSVGVIQLG